MNKSELTPLWKVTNNNLSPISTTVRASLLKQVIKDRKLSFYPYSMVNRLDEERLCLCPLMKFLTNSLLERTHRVGRYFIEPHSCRSFKGCREGLTHDFVWNPLKMHCSLESCNMITWVTRSIIQVQGRHLELQR